MLGVGLVMRRRGRAGEMVDVGNSGHQQPGGKLVDHVMLDETELRMMNEVPDILATPGQEVVEADDDRAVADQPVAEVRPDEPRAARDERDPVLELHLRLPILRRVEALAAPMRSIAGARAATPIFDGRHLPSSAAAA